MTTTIPSNVRAAPTGSVDQGAPVEQGAPATKGTPTKNNIPPTPGASTGVNSALGAGAPPLPAPVTGLPQNLDMESLVKLISEQSRKELTASTIATIKARGQRKLGMLKEQVEQIKKQIDEANKPTSLLKKIFGWIGAIVGVIAAVAAVVATAGAATPLLVGAACLTAGVAVISLADHIMQEASGGSVSLGKGFSKMLKAFGVDEKKADIIGMAVVGAVLLLGSLVGAAMTAGAGSVTLGTSLKSAAKMVKTISALTQSALAVTNGSLAIVGAVSQNKIDMAGVSLKQLQAMLEQLKAITEQEESFLKVMLEEEQLIVKTVQKIVEGATKTEQAIMTGGAAAPSMA